MSILQYIIIQIQYYLYKFLQPKQKLLINLLFFLVIYYLFYINSLNFCMQDPDDFLHKELLKLMQENIRLKENLTTLENQNNELRNIVRTFIADKNELQTQHENILQSLEFEKIETAKQDSLREATSSRVITSLVESQQHFFDESRMLQGQLEEAQHEMNEMAGNNMELRTEAIEQHRISQIEKKQLEETIDELSQDQLKRKKTK